MSDLPGFTVVPRTEAKFDDLIPEAQFAAFASERTYDLDGAIADYTALRILVEKTIRWCRMLKSVKTSTTDPLQIQSVAVSENRGVIGMTLCPGRKGPSLAGGSWDRDLDADLAVVRRWQPSIVVSLLEEHEYGLLGVPDFQSRVDKSGLQWLFAPIPDGDIPGTAFSEAWQVIGPLARNALRKDGRVLIHCRAGLGRTGLVAACLLIDFGAEPEDAIDAVRQARPNTIETHAQKAHVLSYTAAPGRPDRESST